MTKQWKVVVSVLLGIILGVVSYALVALNPLRQFLTSAPPPAGETAGAPSLTATAEDLPIREPILE